MFDAIFRSDRDHRTAIIFANREYTYAALRAETVATAERILDLRLSAGSRVAILLHDSPEFIAAFLAIQSLGLIAVPINTGLRPHEQQLILADSSAAAAILEADLCRSLLTGAMEQLQRLRKNQPFMR